MKTLKLSPSHVALDSNNQVQRSFLELTDSEFNILSSVSFSAHILAQRIAKMEQLLVRNLEQSVEDKIRAAKKQHEIVQAKMF